MKITELGVYPDLPAADYHAQVEWLSVSGAKKLLKPSCPAKYAAALGVEEHKPQFDLGKAVHTAVLGDGEEFVVVEADSWRSTDARLARDDAYMAGQIPLLTADHEQVLAMAAAVKAHPLGAALFGAGIPEVSLFWVDPATGVQCKARLDWLPEQVPGRRLIVPDLKTAVSAEPGEFARNAARFLYHGQDAHYSEGVVACDIDRDPAFVFVVVEKDPPHVVTVCQLADDDKKLGAALMDKARRIYAECTSTGTWPGYTTEVAQVSLPAWHHYDMEEYLA